MLPGCRVAERGLCWGVASGGVGSRAVVRRAVAARAPCAVLQACGRTRTRWCRSVCACC